MQEAINIHKTIGALGGEFRLRPFPDPNIEIDGADKLAQLGKYGRLRLNYLHGYKPETYRELFFTGKLAERKHRQSCV